MGSWRRGELERLAYSTGAAEERALLRMEPVLEYVSWSLFCIRRIMHVSPFLLLGGIILAPSLDKGRNYTN